MLDACTFTEIMYISVKKGFYSAIQAIIAPWRFLPEGGSSNGAIRHSCVNWKISIIR